MTAACNAAVAIRSTVAAIGFALGASIPAPTAAAPAQALATAGSERTSIRRGAELAALGDCATCHTAPGGTPFAEDRCGP